MTRAGWWERTAVVTCDDLQTASAALFAVGAQGLQEDHLPGQAPAPRQPWDEGPLPPPPARIVLRAWFEGVDSTDVDARCGPGEWTPVDMRDWVAESQAGFTPVEISDRLVVAPPWDTRPGCLVLEPGLGFGTGAHPTTRAALVAVDALCDEVRTLLDVGCGSGILALAGAHLGLESTGFDVEEAAVREARRSAELNGLQVDFSTRSFSEIEGQFDLVVANLHVELIVALQADLRRVTGRWLVLAGILADREDRLSGLFDGWVQVRRDVDGEWVCLWLRVP